LEAERLVKSGEKNSSKIIKHIKDMISAEKLANVEYIKIVDQEDLRDVNEIDKKALIALAVRFGSTRLIDNIEVEV
jgi:pantoate--beta-alanine ligase